MLQETHPLDIRGAVVPPVEVLVMTDERAGERMRQTLPRVILVRQVMNELALARGRLMNPQVFVQSLLDRGCIEVARHQAIFWC